MSQSSTAKSSAHGRHSPPTTPRAAPNGTRSAVAPHAPPAQTNPAHLGYGCTGWENHLSIESNGPQRISVSHPGSHFGRFRRPAGYGVMGGRPRRSPHPQEVPQAGSAAQRRPAGARGAGRWPRVVGAGGAAAGDRRGIKPLWGRNSRANAICPRLGRTARTKDPRFLPKRGLLLCTDNARKRQA